MHIRPIRTDSDHETALREIEALWGAQDGTAAGDRLDALVTLVDAYEGQRWPIAPLDPVQAIEAATARNGHTRLPCWSAKFAADWNCTRAWGDRINQGAMEVNVHK